MTEQVAEPQASSPSPSPSRRRAGLVLGAALAVAVLVVVAGVIFVRSDQASAEDHRFVIPAGTGDRIEAGEAVEVLPDELVVHTGDTLTVVNDDDEAHFVGVAQVQPGDTFSYEFPAVGQYESTCTVHQAGAIEIIVER